MPKVTLTPENKVQTKVAYPKVSLEYGDRVLLVCIEPDPTVEFVHTLRAPEIGPDGHVVTEEKTTKSGGKYESVVTEFIGQHLCFGNFDTVVENGVDPDNCPTCQAAVEENGVTAPDRRYAMHVLRYATQPGGWTLREPFQLDCLAWVFSDNRFNTIVDLAADAGGDLRKHDLRLGPCESKQYQKYDIHVVPADAAWLASEERKQYAKSVYENNRSEDLSEVIARRIDKHKAIEDVNRVLERVRESQSASKPAASEAVSQAAAMDIWSDTPSTATGAAVTDASTPEAGKPATSSAMDLSDIMNSL